VKSKKLTISFLATVARPPRPPALVLLPAEKSKIETICEVVGYGFNEIETQLSGQDMNIYVKVQLLQQIDDVCILDNLFVNVLLNSYSLWKVFATFSISRGQDFCSRT